MAEKLNIYQKLAKIRKPVEVLQKNKQGFGYRYVTEDVILSKITGLMDKYQVSLIPNILYGTTKVEPYTYSKTKSTKDGKIYEEKVKEILVTCDMDWQWVNNDNPEDRIVIPWTAVGQQVDASQALGSGLSYSSRYFLLKFFNVATSDEDPDNWRKLQKEAEEAEEKEISAKIIEKIHSIVMAHLEKNPDDKTKVISLTKKYAKTKDGKASGDYNNIVRSADAAALLAEISKLAGISDEKSDPNKLKKNKRRQSNGISQWMLRNLLERRRQRQLYHCTLGNNQKN